MKRVKKIAIIFFALAVSVNKAKAQDSGRVEGLFAFFAGAPIEYGFEECRIYIAAHPLLGIDSINNKRGIYSSFKAGFAHFPFPDSAQVRILLAERTKAWQMSLPGDTAKGISLEAVFEKGRAGKKASQSVYRDIRKELNKYYRMTTGDNTEMAFSKGVNEKFPDCLLATGYSSELRFYYVIIEYWGL
jgi:hypothetical protein